MRTAIIVVLVLLCVTMAGCSWLNSVAPSQVDEQGNPLPGTHELQGTAKTIVDVSGPYGQAAAGIFLLVWNFYERAKSNKNEKGLVATIKAIKAAGDDPATKAAYEAIKAYLASAHDAAGVTALINQLIAKVKSGTA